MFNRASTGDRRSGGLTYDCQGFRELSAQQRERERERERERLNETFTEITFEQKPGDPEECVLKGKTFPVKGTQNAEFDTTIKTYKETHEVTAKASGSNLKLGENKATFETLTPFVVEPVTEEEWSIQES